MERARAMTQPEAPGPRPPRRTKRRQREARITTRRRQRPKVHDHRAPRLPNRTSALPESGAPALDIACSERYEIQRQIGLGGHAEVLLGVIRGADGFHRPVAIKRVRPDLANQDKLVAMLVDEAQHAAELFHPNVVSVLDFNRDSKGRPYLVMEHVDGVDLATLIETGPVPHAVAIFIVRELLSGLGYIHELRGQDPDRVRGLVHCDVTPRNVLLSWAGAVKIADFALAQIVWETMTEEANTRGGTPGYMSPEQARREALDGRSDLYSVGVMLWELLACKRLRTRLPGDIRRPSELRKVSADLEAVAMRLLAYDREERYRTAELAAADLMRCQDAPRDGRGEIVRLLDERFPRPLLPGSRSRCLDMGPSTVTATW
jgi:serine/threonine protein kinase